MSLSHKVVWNEGMFLSPHNFQGWERYLRSESNARLKALNIFDWGLTDLAINETEIANGNFSLLKCEGIMPDGLPFSIPEPDPAPETRVIGEHFSHVAEKLEVFLGLPVERADAPNCRLESDTGGRETRFTSDFVSINDENTGENKREIRIARTNFKILFAGELLDDYTCIKIAELERSPGGTFKLRQNFIPSSLYIGSSKRIMAILRELLDLLSGKSSSLSQKLGQKSATQYEFHARDLNDFGYLITMNSYFPLFSHYYHQARIHPETLYRTMAELAGALSTFHTEITARDIPPYNHTEITGTLERLEQLIKRLLPQDGGDCVTIPLRKTSESRLEGDIPPDLLAISQFFLAATAAVAEGQLPNLLPRMIKIAASDKIDAIVRLALPGLQFNYTGRPHPAIPVKVGWDYFKLTTEGERWDEVTRSKRIAIHLPAGIPGVQLELLAVKG